MWYEEGKEEISIIYLYINKLNNNQRGERRQEMTA